MTEKIFEREVSITTTGAAGSATGAGTIEDCHGFLLDVFLNWHGSAPATSVVKITDDDGVELLDAPAGNTDIRYAPRKESSTDHGAATGLYDLHPLNGNLTVTVTLSDALTACLVAKVRYLLTNRWSGGE